MGRGYIVDDAVEGYLSTLCGQQAGPTTGLLIGQVSSRLCSVRRRDVTFTGKATSLIGQNKILRPSSAQRDFVIMAARTPQREESPAASSLDKEWVTEHARQVSRMLPGGLSILGVFIITDTDGKDSLTTARQLVFAVENLISSEHLWKPVDDDITDCIALHINPKTRKTICRTFDVRDPKSMAKPADWKYQSGVCSSWTTVSCCLSVDMMVPFPNGRNNTENMDSCLKEGLKSWADQIMSGVCLIDGKRIQEDTEFTAGQKRNVRQTHTAQLLITPDEKRPTDVVQRCGGSVSVKGTIHSRTFLHNNKPKAKLAEKLLKRDVLSTVATRVQMLVEELLSSEEGSKSSGDERHGEHLCLPRRVFCSLNAPGPVCVCDYRFNDEGLSELTERLKEMLDIDVAEEDLDTEQETTAEITESNVIAEPSVESAAVLLEPKGNNFTGVVIGAAVALLASAASLLYLNDV